MNISLNPLIWGQGQMTAVPSIIIDKHMRLCGSLPLKVILLILRDNASFNEPKAIAEKLRCDICDVEDALYYWKEAGIISFDDEKPKEIEKEESPKKGTLKEEKIEEKAVPVPSVPEKKFMLSREEVCAMIKNDRILNELINEAQEIFGKIFTSADMDTLVSFYSYYSLSPHFIVTLLTYCASINKKGMAYAKMVAETWIRDGIDDSSVDGHVDRLLALKGIEGRLKTAFGLDRAFIKSEKEYIERWSEKLKLDVPVICEAFEATVEAIGKMNFKYMDKILTDWSEKGISSREEAKNYKENNQDKSSGNENGESEFMKLLMKNYDKE